MINPVTRRFDVSDATYQRYVKLTGKKNPKPFMESVLNEYLLEQQSEVADINTAPNVDATPVNETQATLPFVNLDPPLTPPVFDDRLRARRKNLGCGINPFDKNFAWAWAYACVEFDGGELALVEHLEEQTALPNGARLNKPRALVIARWNEAGRPYVTTLDVPRRG